MKKTIVTAVAGTLLLLGVLLATTTHADSPTWIQGPGTVPDALIEHGLALGGIYGPTDTIVLEGATTVGDLAALEPHIAAGAFRGDDPNDPVYVVFTHGSYQLNDPGLAPFAGDTAMLVLDKDGTLRASTFYRLGQSPQIEDSTPAFDPSFDIDTLGPQIGS